MTTLAAHANLFSTLLGLCVALSILAAWCFVVEARANKVGGIHFIRLGRVQFSVCTVRKVSAKRIKLALR